MTGKVADFGLGLVTAAMMSESYSANRTFSAAWDGYRRQSKNDAQVTGGFGAGLS
jgi:hypothetical protein